MTFTSTPVRSLLLVMLGLAIPVAASAADDFDDLRLGVGLLPGIKHVTVDAGGASGTFDTSAKTGAAVDLGLQHGQMVNGPWGWVAGAGIFVDGYKGESNGSTFKANAYGIQIDGGLLYQPDPAVQFELTPFVGIGLDQVKDTFGSGHGLFFKYGVDLAALYNFNAHWQAGLDVGYEGFHAKGKGTLLPISGEETATAKGQGVIAGLILGYRF